MTIQPTNPHERVNPDLLPRRTFYRSISEEITAILDQSGSETTFRTQLPENLSNRQPEMFEMEIEKENPPA